MNVDILNLFTDLPGNLLYFLTVIGVSQAAFFIALGQRMRHPQERGARRLALAAAGATAGWAALVVGALLALSGQADSSAVLPPLERAASIWALVWIGWAFLSAESERAPRWLDVGLVVLLALVLATYVYTAAEWSGLAATTAFNESRFALPWTFASVVLGIVGIVFLIARYRGARDVSLKVAFFLVVIAGHTATLAQLTSERLPGDYAGGGRLGMLAAMPVFLAVVYRHIIYRLITATEVSEVPAPAEAEPLPAEPTYTPEPLQVEAPKLETPPRMAITHAVDLMMSQKDPYQVPYQVALSLATALKADIVVVLSVDDNWADVLAAYDHIQQRTITGLALNLDEQPTLVEALRTQSQKLILPDNNPEELRDLYSRLDVSQTGPAYFQPIVREAQSTGVIVVALPYSQRQLLTNEQKLLGELASVVGGVLSMAEVALGARFAAETAPEPRPEEAAAEGEEFAETAPHELREARQQIVELTDLVRNLQIELDYERGRLTSMGLGEEEALTLSQQMEALRAEREELAAERDRLAASLTEAKTTLVTATAEDNAAILQGMVDALTREKEELEAQRDALKAELERLSASATQPDAVAQVLQSLTEETERLAAERDQTAAELRNVEAQLEALGIEGGTTGLAQLLGQLYDERDRLVEQNRELRAEREQAARERGEAGEDLGDVESRVLLRAQISHLANDREALTVQRDALHRERDDLARQVEETQGRAEALVQERDQMAGRLSELEADLQEAISLGQHLSDERDEFSAAITSLEAERDQLRAGLVGRAEELETLDVELQSVEALRDQLADLSQERAGLETELTASRSDAARLQERLQLTEEKLQDTEAAVEIAIEEALAIRRRQMETTAEVIASISQELRTPMSSITGYTDLLLGESGGILGAMQRNFIQRVKTNTERMGTLLEDLIRVSAMDVGRLELAPEPVDTIKAIEEAIMSCSYQFREKVTTLRMDLPDELPTIQADRDAFQQIMTQLLSNACLASPVHGGVLLTARQEASALSASDGSQYTAPCLFVSVKDQGGGIDPADMERVFSRKYRADNPLIQGLGDTGVGLSIAKALVEMQGGRIWMESEQGVGSTFMFVLPLEQPPQQGE